MEYGSKRRVAIICLPGLDGFLQWAERLGPCYEARVFLVSSLDDIKRAVEWCDIAFFEWANESAISGVPHALHANKKTVVRMHSYEAFAGYLAQIPLTQVDRVILVGGHFRTIVNFEGVNTEVIPNGVDLNTIPLLSPDPGFEIAAVGAVSYKKNPAMLLQIIEKLVRHDSRYRLHIAGEIQDPRFGLYLKQTVDKMGLEENVLFYGHVPDMNEFYRGKNTLLHSSLQEGHCVSIIEAMARGIPPVIHSFYGAEHQYDDDMLYLTVDEAVEMIIGQEGGLTGGYCRDYVERHGWTLQSQTESFRKVFDAL